VNDVRQIHQYTWLIVSWLGCCALSDITIAMGITRSLLVARSGVRVKDRLVPNLIGWTVTTGGAPAACALLELLIFIMYPNAFGVFPVDIVLAKLYSISLLAFLNRRRRSSDREGHQQDIQRGSYELQTWNSMQFPATSDAGSGLASSLTYRNRVHISIGEEHDAVIFGLGGIE